MAQLFPQWTNKLPLVILLGMLGFTVSVVAFFWYFGSPWYTDVGYQPKQPVPFSHKLHAGDLGMDCRYCHSSVERSHEANIPSIQTCMHCHRTIKIDSEKLMLIRDSWESRDKDTKRPVKWIRVHKLPDYAYFDHSLHLRAGIGCASCHGNVAAMEIVRQVKPLSMSWCLDCHRDPEKEIRPIDENPDLITDMNWQPGTTHAEKIKSMKSRLQLQAPEDCSACHR